MKWKSIKTLGKKFGPGVITGAADDDPSGIATYSQTGAQFGYGQLWTALFILPLQAAVQEINGRIGLVTGKGIAAVIKEHYGSKLLYFIVLALLIANSINIGANLAAMAEAMRLLVPVNNIVLILFFTGLTLLLEIFVHYKRYAAFLMGLSLFLLAYPISLFIINPSWTDVLRATLIPHIEFNYQFIFIITGLLGTTISPYLFFWQASQEVEELNDTNAVSTSTSNMIKDLRIDTIIGMVCSQIAAWSIIVVTGTALHQTGVTDIKTAADAAKALQPLVHSFPHAGLIAECIFAIGIIGLGLLSIPVLAGSSAYAICEAFGWKHGLNLTFKQGRGFYSVIILATLIGVGLDFSNIPPFKALVYAAVINGIAAVPLLFIIGLIGRNTAIMGNFKSRWLSNILLWLAVLCMAAAALAMFYLFIAGSK